MARVKLLVQLLVYIICVYIVALGIENMLRQWRNVWFLKNLYSDKQEQLITLKEEKDIKDLKLGK
jgi:hypothetical protein